MPARQSIRRQQRGTPLTHRTRRRRSPQHDPKTLFAKEPPILSPHAVNIHGASIRLAPGLVVFGLGGSLDATRGGSTHWKGARLPMAESESAADAGMPGFPYGNREADFHRELEAAFESAELHEGDQVLLLTHVGPHACGTPVRRAAAPGLDADAADCAETTIDRSEAGAPPIYAGSKGVAEVLEKRVRLRSPPLARPTQRAVGGLGVSPFQ